MIVTYLFFLVASLSLSSFCVMFAEVPILPVLQLARVLLLALASDWSSVLRSERRWELVSTLVLSRNTYFCHVSLIFYWRTLVVPYSQFFQKLEEKIHAKELEQTNMQEKSKVGVPFIFYLHKASMIFVCFSSEINYAHSGEPRGWDQTTEEKPDI